MSVLNYSFRIITSKTVHSNAFIMLEITQLLHTTIKHRVYFRVNLKNIIN
jgi:ABC-type ATPase involved in cell division